MSSPADLSENSDYLIYHTQLIKSETFYNSVNLCVYVRSGQAEDEVLTKKSYVFIALYNILFSSVSSY